MRLDGRSMRDCILDAAVQLFAEYGYHAAPLRTIALHAGIKAASIYHHYPNKQSLLVEIMETHMQRLNESIKRIIQLQLEPGRCLHEAIANHIRMHTTSKSEFFIIDTEIRSLEGKNRSYILSLRDQYEAYLQTVLRDGMEKGIFRDCDVKVTSYAIIAMCTQVSVWFRDGGRLTVQQVIDMYSQLITQGLFVSQPSLQVKEPSTRP